MISAVPFSSSLSWLIGEFFICIVAMLGGALVLWGHWTEKKADEAGKKEHPEIFIDEIKLLKLKSKRGWKMLMCGILIETVIVGIFAARDGWEIRQIKINGAKNDLVDRPIEDIFARVSIDLYGDKFIENPVQWGTTPEVADLILEDTNIPVGLSFL